MLPIITMSVTACVIRATDAPGIRREMLEIARKSLRVVLDADQVGILLAEFNQTAGELHSYPFQPRTCR